MGYSDLHPCTEKMPFAKNFFFFVPDLVLEIAANEKIIVYINTDHVVGYRRELYNFSFENGHIQ